MKLKSALAQDQGAYFRNKNAARFPSYPLQPAIRAILEKDPNFHCSAVDIVSCRNSLEFLLDFVRNASDKGFRILVETIGSTTFVIRRTNSPTEIIPDIRGHGHTFCEIMTQWDHDVRKSESHHRIIQYDLAGLSCIVRFEIDGYGGEATSTPNRRTDEDIHDVDIDLIVDKVRDVNMSHLTVDNAGELVPQSSLLEIKTRSLLSKNRDHLSELMPRLWLSQVRQLVLAWHEAGLFEYPSVSDVTEEVDKLEKDNSQALRQFVALLKSVIEFARGRPDGRFELIHEQGADRLELREVEEDVNPLLPEPLKDRWISGDADAPILSSEKEEDTREERKQCDEDPAYFSRSYWSRLLTSDSDGDGGQDYTMFCI